MTKRICAALILAVLAAACGGTADEPEQRTLTIYSGRSEELVGPLIDRFAEKAGIEVDVKYGDTAALATTILEEGDNSPADLFFAQDAGSLGALDAENRFIGLEPDLLAAVPERFQADSGRWIGTSGRVRVIAFNPSLVEEADVPDSVFDLTAAKWKGQVGWAPTNGSFLVFLTGMRAVEGEAKAKAWLEDMKANDTQVFDSNDSIAEAIAEEDITLGLVNHYYPFEVREEIPGADVEAHFLSDGDIGGLINVAGAGILGTTDHRDEAIEFIEYLLSEEGQEFFVEETWEYPVLPGFEADPRLPALDELEAPDVELNDLGDLEGTLELLQDVGLT